MKAEACIVVVDVGCRWGFAEDFLPVIDRYKVYGFDPDPQECERLNRQYDHPAIQAVPLALGQENAWQTLYHTQEPACSSLYRPDPELTAHYAALACQTEIGQSSIQVQRLDDWARGHGLSAVHHLKIDTQGSELDVLRGAGCLLETTRSIQVEVEFNPTYLGQPVFSDIDQYLRKQGFILWKLSEITHYSRNRCAQPPMGLVDVRFDDWVSQRLGVYAGQLFWANAHYVKQDVLGSQDPALRERDEILFTTLGMPDVLGDQAAWTQAVHERIQPASQAAQAHVGQLKTMTERAIQAERQLAQAERQAAQAKSQVVQAESRATHFATQAVQQAEQIRYLQSELALSQDMAEQFASQLALTQASTSWRLTAPLRRLKRIWQTLTIQ